MNLTDLFTHIDQLVSGVDSLSDIEGKIYVGVADAFPAVTIDGIVASADKQGSYTFNLNLILRAENKSFSECADFYERVEALSAAIEQSNMIIGGNWLDRPENGFLRALFPCKSA